MAKLVSLKRAKSEQSKTAKIEEYTNPDDAGVRVELDHHHLTKLGVGGDLKSGDDVGFNGHGTVERSETRSSKDGERHSATIRLHKGAIDHKASAEDERAELRDEIEKNAGSAAKGK